MNHPRLFPVRLVTLIASLSLFLPLFSADPLNENIIDQTVKALFQKHLEQNQKKYGNESERYFIRQGILADKKARKVEILSVFTGISDNMPLEFILVGAHGKDYESVAVTLATAADIRQAMQFIGIAPGEPVNGKKFLFWPRGERMIITASWRDKDKEYAIPANKLTWQPKKGRSLPVLHWVFTGSFYATANQRRYLAADDTGDFISIFNSAWTLFDLPRQAPQTAVYGQTYVNTKITPPPRTPITFTIQPLKPEKQSSIYDLDIFIKKHPNIAPQAKPWEQIVIECRPHREGAAPSSTTFPGMLEKLQPLVKDDFDIFLWCHPQAGISAGLLSQFYQALQPVIDRDLLKIYPAPDEIYYQAFLPQKEWLKLEQRPVQPIELHFTPPDASPPYRFVYHEELIGAQGELSYRTHRFDFATPRDLLTILEKKKDWATNTLFFFVPPDMSYGTVKKWYLPLKNRFPILYVFIVNQPSKP